MTIKTIPQLRSEIAANFPDNTSAAITPALTRTTEVDIVDTMGSLSSRTFTRASAIATNFDIPPLSIQTIGRDTAGDGGEALYIKVGSAPSHPAYFTTADGAFYEMFPEHGELNFMAYGTHVAMSNYLVQPTIGGPEDCYASFTIADKHIAAKNYGGITLRLPAGKSLFTSKSFQIRRIRYNIKASGTGHTTSSGIVFLRTPVGVDAIIGAHALGSGHDYTIYQANVAYGLGTGTYNAGNFYRCVTAGTTGASSPPTGTGGSIVDGTVHWGFDGAAGDVDISPTSPGADGAIIENVYCWSFWRATVDPWPDQNLTLGGLPIYDAAFLARTRMTFRNCFALGYNGYAFDMVGGGDSENLGYGNVDAFRLEDCGAYYNGKDGLHVGTMNANAGSCTNFDTANNFRWGINDNSLLGNYYEMHQSAYDGTNGVSSTITQYPGSVLHNGYFWYARVPRNGIDPVAKYHLEPGTSPLNWIRGFGNGTSAPGTGGPTFPDWNNTQKYEPGGAFCTNYGVAVNTWMHMYVEGGTRGGQPNVLDLVVSGVNEATIIEERAPIFIDRGNFRGTLRTIVKYASNSGDKFFIVNLGTDPTIWNNGQPTSNVLIIGDWEGNGYNLRAVSNAVNGESALDYLMNDSWGWTGSSSTRGWGRSAGVSVPNTFISQGRLLATGALSGGAPYAQYETTAGAAPTSGTWQEGDRVYAISPSSLGWVGWVCRVSGTPGTWKKFGQLEP